MMQEQMIDASIKIPLSILIEHLAEKIPASRQESMVKTYGEACTKRTASRIIGASPSSINRMIDDGRIKTACEGTRVDVRSLSDYIERKTEADREARIEKKRRCRK